MFDRYLQCHQRTPSHTSVDVTEKRAPTDESVRLLSEMEQAARQKVVQSIRLENCPVDAVIQRHDDFLNVQMVFSIHARIGGQVVEARKTFDLKGDIGFTVIAEGLMQALAEQIAMRVLGPAINKAASQLRLPR